jgi:hypothetical protein
MDRFNKAYPEANILTIVKLIKSVNRNKEKLVCNGKVTSYIKYNGLKSQHPSIRIPQPTICSRCHGYNTEIWKKTLSCPKCGVKHDAKSCTSETKSWHKCKDNHSAYYKRCPYYKSHSMAMSRKASPMHNASNNPGTLAGFSLKRKPSHRSLQDQPTKKQQLTYQSPLVNRSEKSSNLSKLDWMKLNRSRL